MDKAKKVVKKAKAQGWTWEKTMKVLAPIISWLTKGKIEKNTVLAILGIAGSVFVNTQKADVVAVEAAMDKIEQTQAQLPSPEQAYADSVDFAEMKRFYGIEE